jgi:hypothetical protein
MGVVRAGDTGSHSYVDNPHYPLEKTLAMLQLDSVGVCEGYHLEAQGIHKQDGLLLYAIHQSKALADGRQQITVPGIISALPLEWFYAPAVRFNHARIGNANDQAPFRNARIQTILIVWRGASEDNSADEIAVEINIYRLFIT